MKHAILIMAHRYIEHLKRLVEYFSSDCDVFIHVDQKNPLDESSLACLSAYKQVKLVSQEFDVNWGGTSVLDCEMYLLRVALRQSDADYYHLISGQDYPVRPLSQFLETFSRGEGKEYIHYTRIPNPRWEGNTYRRLQYYYPYDYSADKEQPKKWVREQLRMQHARGIKRPIPDEFDKLYGSSQWFSITRKAVTELIKYTQENPSLYRKMWMTFAPEECYVATVLVNLMGESNIEPTNYRFIRWQFENGNRPANLGREHFSYLLEREYLLARKIDFPCSIPLIELIDKFLLKDSAIHVLPSGGWEYDGFRRYEYEEPFFRIVVQLCQELGINSAIDMGCGAGFYVMQWRRIGLPFAGYDANPYTPMLSSILLPEGDTPCGVADITEDLDIVSPFELVVCKDVLPYIPESLMPKAIRNLIAMSSHFILVSWKRESSDDVPQGNAWDEERITPEFEQGGFVKEKYLTTRMQIILKRTDCCIYMKEGTFIIN